MTTPKIGLAGQTINLNGPGSNHASQITAVHGDGTVDARNVGGTSDRTSLPFVDVGGSQPSSGEFFQAIDAVN